MKFHTRAAVLSSVVFAVFGFASLASAASIHLISADGLSDSTAGANQRKLVRTSDGAYHAVYHKLNGDGYYQIYCADSTDGGQTWTETALISGPLVTSISHDNRPSIVSDSQDNLYVVWWGKSADSPTYNQIRLVKYSHATGTWGSLQTLTNESADQSMSSMVVDSHDDIYLAWNGKDAASPSYTQIRVIKFTAATDSWGPISDLTAESYDQQRPFITVDYEDNLHLAWYGKDAASPSYTQIRYMKYSSGAWSPVYDVTSGDYAQDFVSLAVDSLNNVHLTWHGSDASSPAMQQIRYVEYVKATSTWGDIDTLSSEQYGRGQWNPYIAIDASDIVRIVWNGRFDPDNGIYDIRYAQKAGSGWNATVELTDDAVDNQYPTLIWYVNPLVNGARLNRPRTGYAFVWSSGTSVYFYKSDDLTWDTPAVRHAPGSGQAPQIVTPPSIVLTRPFAGTALVPRSVIAVEWKGLDAAYSKYRVSYSLDGGATWKEAVTLGCTSEAYSWEVPDVLAAGFFRVEGLDGEGKTLASAQNAFSIAGTVRYSPREAQESSPDINADKGWKASEGSGPCEAGTLIKGSAPSVYYCGNDGKRHAFVDEASFFSWYADFSGVRTVDDETLSKITLGDNVTYRPGLRLVKIMSDPRVYAVDKGGVLRWVPSEEAAQALFGPDWRKLVIDVPEAFFVDYRVGDSI
jgi:hypothetical protein